MRTAQDFLSLTSKIQMDLNAAQAKLTELRAWIAGLDLPTDEQPFREETAMTFVRNTAHVYTDYSLSEELRGMGATDQTVADALVLAQVVRANQRPDEIEGVAV